MSSSVPAGVDPVQYMNYLAKLQAYRQNQQYEQQLAQQQAAQQAGAQQFQLLLRLLEDAQQKYNAARTANEVRRNDILKGRTDTRNRILDHWNQFGDSLIVDTNRGYQRNLDNSLAALAQSGLLQSTVNSSIRSQNERERQDSLRRVKDQVLGNYAAADERLSNNIDEFQERIVDAYPDTGGLAAIAAQAGAIIPTASSAYGGGGQIGNRSPVYGYGGNLRRVPMSALGGPFSAQRSQSPPRVPMQATPPPPEPLNDYVAMQQDSTEQGLRQLPWQTNNLLGESPGSKVPLFTTGYQPLVAPMPALGIFGAGLQAFDAGSGGGAYGVPVVRPVQSARPAPGSNPFRRQRLSRRPARRTKPPVDMKSTEELVRNLSLY